VNAAFDLEPERYELIETLFESEQTRRDFFRAAGAGVIVALLASDDTTAQPPRGGNAPRELNAWIHVGEDSSVAVYTGKVEVGQNIRTSLAQTVADELHCPLNSVRLVMADTALVPFDSGTFGSQTTPRMASQLRRAAAAARETLLDLAAQKSQVDRVSLSAFDGKVAGPRGKPSFTFGELTQGRKLMKLIAATVTTTPAKAWSVTGKSHVKVDGRSFVTGSHQYASDIRRPGMLFGKVLRPPAFRSKLVSINTTGAEGMRGITVVRDGDFVAVAGSTQLAATEALGLIKAEWEAPPQVSSKGLYKHLKENRGAGGKGGRGGASAQGSIEDGLEAADKIIKSAFTIAYIAHVPLEPRAAVAEWTDGKLTVWTGTQRPFGVRGDLARALRIPEANIRVIVPDTGSGYGGKHTVETATEAARLAKAAGKPVKIVWTREEEFTWAYFRPAGVIEVTAAAKADGALTAWEHHNYNSGASAIRTPYSVPNVRTEFHSSDSPLRQGSYRALAATANCFARESAMDELAHTLGIDPLEFRLKNLKEPRLRTVLETAAKGFRWGQAKSGEGRGFGLACGTEKGSFVATCAEITVDRKAQVRVARATTAFECGAVLNPDHLKNQIEGSIIMGLGGALFEQIDFADGKIQNPSFSDYRLPRFRDTPVLETILVDRKDLPSEGAGETPIIAVAPAVGNAIFAATGIRPRSMPMVPDGLPAKER
jgi:isoquinoline 1-oxidoreductase